MKGRLALITGSGGDIGRAVAARLAASGARLVLADLDRQREALEETASMCRLADPGSVAVTTCFDVVDDADVVRAIAGVVDEAGAPDAVFNNAGYQGVFANVLDYDVDDFRRVLEVNVVGLFNVLKVAGGALRAAGRPGAIVNMASMAGVGGAPNMVAYSASKAAVIGLTKSAAKDLAGAGIRVNAVSPGFIGPGAMWDRQVELQASTPSQYYAADIDDVERQMIDQVPLRRYGSLDEVAAVVQFLLSDESSYVNAHNIEISGGAA